MALEAGLPHESLSAELTVERAGAVMDTHMGLLVVALGEETMAAGMRAHETGGGCG